MELLRTITVRGGKVLVEGREFPCTLGPAGIRTDKVEGDGATPAGSFPMRWCYYRPDKFAAPPQTQLPLIGLTENDGWCNDVHHALYNQPVTLPFDGHHEKLWRDDGIYDLIIPLGYNDDPVKVGKGSCIFMHLMRADRSPTEGCVGLTQEDLLALLPRFSPQTVVTIEG